MDPYWSNQAPAMPPGDDVAAPSPLVSVLFRVINVGVCVMMAATGAMSLASFGSVNENQLSGAVVSLYLLLFSATWFAFEASQVKSCDFVVVQLKRNFGFLFHPLGKSLFIIFCAFLNFGVQASALGLATGLCCIADGVILILLYLKRPDLYPG